MIVFRGHQDPFTVQKLVGEEADIIHIIESFCAESELVQVLVHAERCYQAGGRCFLLASEENRWMTEKLSTIGD